MDVEEEMLGNLCILICYKTAPNFETSSGQKNNSIEGWHRGFSSWLGN